MIHLSRSRRSLMLNGSKWFIHSPFYTTLSQFHPEVKNRLSVAEEDHTHAHMHRWLHACWYTHFCLGRAHTCTQICAHRLGCWDLKTLQLHFFWTRLHTRMQTVSHLLSLALFLFSHLLTHKYAHTCSLTQSHSLTYTRTHTHTVYTTVNTLIYSAPAEQSRAKRS